MNYQITNQHWLKGDPEVKDIYKATKNRKSFDGNYPDTIIIHYTAGRDAASSAKYLADHSVQASAHLVIGRDGTVYQLAPFDKITWHAGISNYQGRTGWNNYAIGIELDNAGVLTRSGTKYTSWFGEVIPEDQVSQAVHRNENEARYWQTYTAIQLQVCEEICRTIIPYLSGQGKAVKHILGHEEVSPVRKIDPGPAFPLDKFRDRLIGPGRDLDVFPDDNIALTILEDKLNIRSGAGINFPTVAMPLNKGQKVTVIDEMNGWYKVRTEIEGWVNKAYVK